MKIIVVSDTHMPKKAKKLPKKLIEALEYADLIIHAGDWQTIEVYEELSNYARVEGVAGNVDGPDIEQHFQDKLILSLAGFNIGIVHGHGQKGTTEKRALSAFDGEELDCLIYGHSHIPVLKKQDGMLIFNPGSPTDKRRQPYFSYGILVLEETIHAEHIFFEDKN